MSGNIELPAGTNDLISAVKFGPNNSFICTSSWDGYARLYSVSKALTQPNSFIESTINTGTSILDICWTDNSTVCTGNINGCVYKLDLSQNSLTEIGKQRDLAVQKIKYEQTSGLLSFITWHKTLEMVDTRSGGESTKVVSLSHKPMCFDVNERHLAVATTQNRVEIYDLRNMKAKLHERESGLKFQTSEIELSDSSKNSGNEFFVQSSYEGRIVVDYMSNTSTTQENCLDAENDAKFAFKCHRLTTDDNIDFVSPITSIKIGHDSSSGHNLLYTGGTDGIINLWDLNKKKKMKKFKKYAMGVLKFDVASTDAGDIMAVVTGELGFKNNSDLQKRVNTENFGCSLSMKVI